MEKVTRFRIRFGVFAGLLVAFGVYAHLIAKPVDINLTEEDMVELVPDRVGDFQFREDPRYPGQSGKMDERTYEVLQPFGIVTRTYTKPGKGFDVVLIASNSKESFHDPRWCFGSQGWQIEDDVQRVAHSESQGDIPVAIVSVSQQGQKPQLAAFYYRGPRGIYADMQRLKIDLIIEPLRGGRNMLGAFYRFMPTYKTEDKKLAEKELLEFIGNYADAIHESSDGMF